jgi:hypothetical protein
VSIPTHFDRKEAPGAGSFDPDQLEVAPGRQREGLEGWVPELANETELREALEKAFDYRGDVTIARRDGSSLEGYLFDRVSGPTLSSSFVRILPKTGGGRVKVAYAEVTRIAFSGRDTAAGKSWEAWVRKFWEKKHQGTGEATLHPDTAE